MAISPLSLLLLALPAGALLIWLLPRPGHARVVALGTCLVTLVLSVLVLAQFDPKQSGFQLAAQAEWIPGLGVRYLAGVDGLSVLFLPATALLFLGVVAASWHGVRIMPRLYYSLILLEGAATLGIFCALDTIFFFLLWELSIIPFYLLVSRWGIGPERRTAATKYALIMIGGGIPLLFGFLFLAAETGTGGFDLRVLLDHPLAVEHQLAVFLLLLAGFGVKAPLVPLHTWLPRLAMEGPAAVSALLAGLKVGAYGLIRFAVPLAPQAARELDWLLIGFGTIGTIYGALVAVAQTNLRAMLAYLGISHVGLVLIGMATFRAEGVQGAVFELLNFTLIAGGLFLLTDFLYRRTGSTSLTSLGGAARAMPWLATFFLILGLASLGVPGSAGFPAELLILLAALGTYTGTGLAALAGVIVATGCLLTFYRHAFLGPLTQPALIESTDLQRQEWWVALVFVALVFSLGLYPSAVLEIFEPAVDAWLAHLKLQP